MEEYLATAYCPDCDFVDGEVQDRNVGLWDHSSCVRQRVQDYLNMGVPLGSRSASQGCLHDHSGPTDGVKSKTMSYAPPILSLKHRSPRSSARHAGRILPLDGFPPSAR